MTTRPPVPYNLTPQTFEEALEAVRGMQERKRLYGGPLPTRECVQITAASMLDLFAIVESLQARVADLEAR